MKKNKNVIWGLILFTLVIGCVLPAKKPSEKATSPLGEKEKLIQNYLQKGQVYENKGKLIKASKQYKLALTIDARNQSAVEKNRRIENQLRILAEKYYQEGLKFYKKGKYDLARRKFLMTLRHWPNHSGALEMVRPRKQIPAQNYIVHTIKAGESISQLAMIYYRDYHKFPIIAEYNNLKNATQVYVGQKIKVPQVEGIPFSVKNYDIQAEDVHPKIVKPQKKKPVKDKKKEPPVEIEEETSYRDLGIELFKKKHYQEATIELLKALNANPDDKTSREYIYQSNFNWAMELFEKKDYLIAKKKFETALQYKKNCSKCQDLVKKCEKTYKEIHYNRGIQHFSQENLVEAIKEWEYVHALDPEYKEVLYNLNKAEKLLKKLEEIKKSLQKQETE